MGTEKLGFSQSSRNSHLLCDPEDFTDLQELSFFTHKQEKKKELKKEK